MNPTSPPRNLVVLTGAGVSKESGLDTFRDADGIWAKVRVEDVATPTAFERDPARVHAFYNRRRTRLLSPDVQPNAAHRALADLEHHWPGRFLLVTQNIDDLHERAGSVNLVHMHGELLKARCLRCRGVFEWRDELSVDSLCPQCGKPRRLRPEVVWFGEQPRRMSQIRQALKGCNLFLSVGTSGNVYPAAGFVEEARAHGAHTVELNLEPSNASSLFAETIHGPASLIVPQHVQSLLAGLQP